MDKPLYRFIQFDGIRGAGKTAQVRMLVNHYRSLNYEVESLNLEKFNSLMEGIDYLIKILETTNKIVIQDGSIARPIVLQIVRSVSRDKIAEKFKEEIRKMETVYHKYKSKGFILLNHDLNTCQERLLKKDAILQKTMSKIEDLMEEGCILNVFSIFNDDVLSRSNNFEVLRYSRECILDVHADILKRLQSEEPFR